MVFGSAFGTAPPSLDERMHTIADQLETLVALMAGGGNLPRPTPPAMPDATELVQAVVGLKGPASAEDIAGALHARLNPDDPEMSQAPAVVLSKLAKTMENLDFRLKAGGQAFGASVAAPADTAKEVTQVQVRDKVATETTLASVLAAVDTLEALTTDVRTELRRRPTYRLASTAASIVSGAFATIHTVTPTVAVVVSGLNADLNAVGTFNYRVRLITGTDAAPTVITQEQLSTSQNSWINAALSVPANTRIAVQVLHGEVTAQEFVASLAYYEEP